MDIELLHATLVDRMKMFHMRATASAPLFENRHVRPLRPRFGVPSRKKVSSTRSARGLAAPPFATTTRKYNVCNWAVHESDPSSLSAGAYARRPLPISAGSRVRSRTCLQLGNDRLWYKLGREALAALHLREHGARRRARRDAAGMPEFRDNA